MPNRDLADIRNQYQRATLDRSNLAHDPLQALNAWLKEAIQAKLYEPTAMTLSTVDAQGQPHARIVLLKKLDHGLVFYTYYLSHKGQELAQNQRTACTLFWPELERQIRIEGLVSKTSKTESEDYFKSRPRDSQLAALASRQGEVIASREVLEASFTKLTSHYKNEQSIPCPDHWGGYRVMPHYFEFWQGRPNRLHDRLVFKLTNNLWQRERLSP